MQPCQHCPFPEVGTRQCTGYNMPFFLLFVAVPWRRTHLFLSRPCELQLSLISDRPGCRPLATLFFRCHACPCYPCTLWHTTPTARSAVCRISLYHFTCGSQ